MRRSRSNAITATPPHTPTLYIYVRQSEDETKQASVGSQTRLIDQALARLRADNVIDEQTPVVRLDDDVGCAPYDFTRPDVVRLMSAVRKGDIVVVAWRDRLGSGPRHTAAVEDLVKLRGALLFMAEPFEEVIWTKVSAVVEAVHGSQADSYIDDLKSKTTAALRERLEAGYACGQIPFGYSKEIDPNTRRVVGGIERFKKRVLIDHSKAAILLRPFQMKPTGMGWLSMVKILDSERVPAPSESGWTTGLSWDLLHNERYVGRWGTGRRKFVKQGKRKIMLPGDSPVTVEHPHLAIVPRELWDRVQRIVQERSSDMRANLQAVKHLLSGIARCVECGGGMSIVIRKGKPTYICSKHVRYGSARCPAKGVVPKALVEDAVLAETAKILTAADDIILTSVRDVVRRRAAASKPAASAPAAKLEGARVDYRRAWKLYCKLDDPPEETVAEVNALAARVKKLEAEHARMAAPTDARRPKEIEIEGLNRLRDLRKALADPKRARTTLERPFPQGLKKYPHTFSLDDAGGTLLIHCRR